MVLRRCWRLLSDEARARDAMHELRMEKIHFNDVVIDPTEKEKLNEPKVFENLARWLGRIPMWPQVAFAVLFIIPLTGFNLATEVLAGEVGVINKAMQVEGAQIAFLNHAAGLDGFQTPLQERRREERVANPDLAHRFAFGLGIEELGGAVSKYCG